jgi:hypothetical protein
MAGARLKNNVPARVMGQSLMPFDGTREDENGHGT